MEFPTAPENLPKQKFLGFYNLSYGFTKQYNKNKQLIFEPYIKLPMSSYSDQLSKFSSTGIRIKMRF